jgi:hypothetical protein
MSKEMQVIAWDDLFLAEGVRVEAQRIDVPVRFGDFEGVLDLTTEHYDEVEGALRSALTALFARENREAAAEKEAKPKRRHVQGPSPLDKLCPYPVGTKERWDYLKGLRYWAGQQGRDGEYKPPEGSAKDDNQYHYPKQLLLDYNAFLSDEARKLAS